MKIDITLQVNSPGTGYVSGFFSSITSSAVQNLGSGKVATVIGGGLTGGVGAIVSGGNFFQGATYGLIASSLNHIAHVIVASSSAGHGDPPTKEQLKIRMYEEYAAGRCSQIEYLYSLDVIDNNPLGMIQNLWEFHKVEIATTAAGMGFTKFVGSVWKAGGLTNWLNTGNWWRLGNGRNLNGERTYRLAWGAHKKYLPQVPKHMQGFNKWLRNLGDGHWHIKKP